MTHNFSKIRHRVPNKFRKGYYRRTTLGAVKLPIVLLEFFWRFFGKIFVYVKNVLHLCRMESKINRNNMRICNPLNLRRTFQTIIVCATLFVSLLTGCNNHPSEDRELVFESFPETDKLTGQAFALDESVPLRYPFRIRLHKGYLFILDLHNAENFFHVYDPETFKHITAFGKRGEGPQEMLQGKEIIITSLDSIWTLDPGKRQIVRWSFSQADSTVKQAEVIRLDRQSVPDARDLAMYNDTTWLLPDLSGKARIWYVNHNGKLIGETGDIPTLQTVKKEGLAPLASAWNPYIGYHAPSQTLVAATQLGDVMEIYHLKENTRHILRGPGGEPEYKVTPQGYSVPTGIMGYSDVLVTSRYIYTIFHGRTFEEIAANPTGTEDGGRQLRLFNLRGLPVRCYYLDHAVYGVHVDEANRTIWTTDVNSEKQIVRYKVRWL